jgi:hypothetical protein
MYCLLFRPEVELVFDMQGHEAKSPVNEQIAKVALKGRERRKV